MVGSVDWIPTVSNEVGVEKDVVAWFAGFDIFTHGIVRSIF